MVTQAGQFEEKRVTQGMTKVMGGEKASTTTGTKVHEGKQEGTYCVSSETNRLAT
jgi:hypothetical protein